MLRVDDFDQIGNENDLKCKKIAYLIKKTVIFLQKNKKCVYNLLVNLFC